MKFYIILLLSILFLNGCCIFNNEKYTQEHAEQVVKIWLIAADKLDDNCPAAAKLYLRREYMENNLTYDEMNHIKTKLGLIKND